MISTATLAKILNVSNAVILERFKKNKKKLVKHSKKINQRRYYDAKAVAIIIKTLKLNKYYKIINKETSGDLRKENKRQAKSIEELHQLLSQQQQLALESQKELKQSQKQLTYHKHNWIWKLFH